MYCLGQIKINFQNKFVKASPNDDYDNAMRSKQKQPIRLGYYNF